MRLKGLVVLVGASINVAKAINRNFSNRQTIAQALSSHLIETNACVSSCCEKGREGVRGARGQRGIQGPKGDRGPLGPKGLQGAMGPQGPQGPAGDQGPNGLVGLQGPAGLSGAGGSDGVDGPQGPQGDPGAKGLTGGDGDAGPEGPKGDRGPVGPPCTPPVPPEGHTPICDEDFMELVTAQGDGKFLEVPACPDGKTIISIFGRVNANSDQVLWAGIENGIGKCVFTHNSQQEVECWALCAKLNLDNALEYASSC